MCILRLNSQIQKYGGFTGGERVFGRAPKLQIGAVGTPHFIDFVYQNGAPVIQTECVRGIAGNSKSVFINRFSGKIQFIFKFQFPTTEKRINIFTTK